MKKNMTLEELLLMNGMTHCSRTAQDWIEKFGLDRASRMCGEQAGLNGHHEYTYSSREYRLAMLTAFGD